MINYEALTERIYRDLWALVENEKYSAYTDVVCDAFFTIEGTIAETIVESLKKGEDYKEVKIVNDENGYTFNGWFEYYIWEEDGQIEFQPSLHGTVTKWNDWRVDYTEYVNKDYVYVI